MAAGPVMRHGVPPAVSRWFSTLGFRQMWKVVVAVGLAATALFGGLDAVNTKVTPIKVGEPFSDGEFTVTFDHATAIDKMPNGIYAPTTPGPHRYLGVVVTLTNDGETPGNLDHEIDLREPDDKFLGVFRMTDSSPVGSLGPKITDKLVFIWELPPNAVPAGSPVTMRVWRKRYLEGIATYGKNWLEGDEYGEITLPVEVKS